MTATRTFATDAAWMALVALLRSQLQDVDVDAIGTQDFNEEGELAVKPPAVRVIFGGETARSFENQGQNYDANQSFGAICADQYLGADPQRQRLASLQLARIAADVVTGSRLKLADGTLTEPAIYVSTKPMPAGDIGMAYCIEWTIPGIAQFPAPNAQPQGGR